MNINPQVQSSGPTRIRHLNRKAVLSYIREQGPNSRSQLGRALSLSGAAMTSVVNELLDNGLLRESENTRRDGRQGRPISLLELNPESACALGIVLSPTSKSTVLGMAFVDYTGQVTTLPEIQVDTIADLDALIAQIEQAITILKQAVPDRKRIAGVTLAIPGVVENENIPMSPKLRCIEGTAFMDRMKQMVNYPVNFCNDVNLAAISELYQQPRLRNLSFAYLYLYSGVGSSIAIKGKLLTGSRGWAGEIGPLHINRRAPGSASFENLLSTDGSLAELLQSLGHPRQALDKLADYIDQRHCGVLEVIDHYCEHVCDAINVLNSVLDVDEILIEVRSETLFQRLRPRLEILLQSAPRQPVLSAPVLGKQAALNGAAISALNLALDDIEVAAK